MNTECLYPRIAVLLASFNGRQWIADQLASLLAQTGVNIHVFISDDFSTDGTWEWLCSKVTTQANITLLPQKHRTGSAGRNFYRLIVDVDTVGFDYVAFSDQDDIWEVDKLSRHITLLQAHQADGVSSNVKAFWPDGKTEIIMKSQAQREFDYIFESAGPGCTFLMTPRLIGEVRTLLNHLDSPARDVSLHDWLTYAVARALGYKWVIDETPSVQYRQHANNVIGANVSFKSKWLRLKKMRDGWYRQQVIKVTRIAYGYSRQEVLRRLLLLLEQPGIGSQLQLLVYVWKGRRSVTDRFYLMSVIIFNLF
ncbi:glycosyltransferase [Methylobacillus gramineus]|uniref:glycosyltransferase n=1 Tax=Methylobacillus gramineus TaxID=755169 RepID=UPI001CFF6DEC|nr:glycosyltransferase [Methylobacillus gramineus]MCB5184130.1 glycosyltransferase [Methylobacillus gramineus]